MFFFTYIPQYSFYGVLKKLPKDEQKMQENDQV